MHLVIPHSDCSYFVLAPFILMRGGVPSPLRIRFARKVPGGGHGTEYHLGQYSDEEFWFWARGDREGQTRTSKNGKRYFHGKVVSSGYVEVPHAWLSPSPVEQNIESLDPMNSN